MIEVCRLRNEALLRPLRKCRHVVRKSGGSWSYVLDINLSPCSQWLTTFVVKSYGGCVLRSPGVKVGGVENDVVVCCVGRCAEVLDVMRRCEW